MFLNPFFLFFGGFALVPLVLHMMQRRRTVRVDFPTIRFLKMAQKRSSSRIRMENFLLWLFRTLIMIFISLAFSLPVIRTQGLQNFFGKAPRDIAIILDNSFSMAYLTGKKAVWDDAMDTVQAIINGLEEGDRVCLFSAGETVTPVVEKPNKDKEFLLGQLKALSMGSGASSLCPATLAAYESLTEDASKREHEIHIITDGQSLPWISFSGADTNIMEKKNSDAGTNAPAGVVGPSLWNPKLIDDKTVFYVSLLGATEPENVAPLDITVEPQPIMKGVPAQLRLQLSHTGPAQDVSVTLKVNNEEVSRRALLLQSYAGGELTFTLPALEAGVHTAMVETPSDNLAVDNQFHFLLDVREAMPVLCVGEKEDVFFLLKALTPGKEEASIIRPKHILAEEIDGEELSLYFSVFLCNVLPLNGQTIVKLEQFARDGGLLVVFPGDRAAPRDYAAWSSLPGIPTRIDELPMDERKQVLRWDNPQHALLKTLRLPPGVVPGITIKRQLRLPTLLPDTEKLISAGAEDPFLLNRGIGDGFVMMFSVSADRSWASWPLSPFFLPIMHQTVQFGAGLSGANPYVWAQDNLPLTRHVPWADENSTLFDPEQDTVPIRMAQDDNRTILRVEKISKPGIYTMTSPDSPDPKSALAVNFPREESDLSPIKEGQIRGLIGTKRINFARNKDDLVRMLNEGREGRSLDEFLLWIALILATVEVFYSNLKSKSADPLTSEMLIDSSGKVHEKGELKLTGGDSEPE